MSSGPLRMPTPSAPSTPPPPTATQHHHTSSWRSWGTKGTGQRVAEGGGSTTTGSPNSSAAPPSVSVTVVVLAALTAATVSVAYNSYKVRSRSSRVYRSQSTTPEHPCTRHGEASDPSHTGDIAMDSVKTASPLSPSTARSDATTCCRSTSLGGCGSTAAHTVAGENPSSTAASENELDEGGQRERDVMAQSPSLALHTDTAADAGARSGNRDMRFALCSAPPLQMAHDSTAEFHDRCATPAASAAPSPPPPETPKALLSNYYDLEPYALQGLAGGAHGWKRVFGLLKPEMRRRSGRDEACAEDGGTAADGIPGRRAPGSLTRTYDGSRVTTTDSPALLRESPGAIVPVTPAAATRSPTRRASAVESMYRSSVVKSDVSVHSRVPGQPVATGKPCTARWYGDDHKLFSVAAASSTSASTLAQPLHPPRLSVSPVAGVPSPPSRFLNSFFFPVLQHLSFCVSRSVGSGPGESTTTGEATSGTAGSGVHTASTTNTFATSAALAVAQRNLQRDISTLVATTASVRLGASASSSFPGSHAHTARCSAVSSVAVSPRAGATGSCRSQQQHEGVTAAESCSSFAALHAGRSSSGGQRRKGVSVEGEEGAAQHVLGSHARFLSAEDKQQPGMRGSPRHQSSGACRQTPASSQKSDRSATWSGAGPCKQSIRESAQERRMPPHPSPRAAATAAGATADSGAVPAPPEASSTEEPNAAGTESVGEPASPPTMAHCCTIAEQLAVLTSRREQQHRYTQQLQASRRSAGLGAGAENALPSPLATPSSPAYTGAAAASTTLDVSNAELSKKASGMRSPFAWASQYYTDTASGVFYSSVLQPHHYENHVYSDVTTEVQQCRRRRQRDRVTSLGAGVTPASRAGAEDEDVGHETHTATPMATGAGAATAASTRRSMERPAAESSLTAGLQPAAARKASASAGTAILTSGVGSVAPLSHSKPTQPSNERRVDDLTVKHQDDGSASYTISLTYHDSETGTSRTVNTSALPPLRRCDAGASIPGLSSLSGGTTVRAAARTKRPTTTATLALSASGAASPAHSRSVSGGEAAHAFAVSSPPARPATATMMGKSLLHSQPHQASDAEDNDNASTTLGLAQAARTGGGRPRPAPRSSISVGGSLKYCSSPAAGATAAGSASGSPACDAAAASTTTASGKVNPFAAPLPPTEPQHGPRLRGVAGRNGEMAIGAFLGGGACGKVYECLNTETGQVLAAKQIVFDAKDRKLRTRLKQLELELEVLTLAARHHVRWIVGFFGAEKRGHSVLMYLEYCQHGSLLDYMMEGNSTDAAVWNTSSALDDATPKPSTAPADRSAGCHFDANGSPPVAAVAAWRRHTESVNEDASCLSARSPLRGLREVRESHTEAAAAPKTNSPKQQRQQQQVADGGSAAAGHAQRAEAEEAAATGHASPQVRTHREESAEGEEYPERREGDCLSTAAASVSSAASSVALSSSALDMMPLSEALHPQMPSLSIEQAQCFTKQIVEGLCFLHQHNYAHLDVKTANVLVAADDECRLADLGCAMRLQPPPPASPPPPQQGLAGMDKAVRGGANGDLDDAFSPPPYPVLVDRDAITELRGTALYMAPEMIRFESHAIGSPADVWSLGCVVMEMTTGCAPWRHIAKDKLRVLYRIGSARDELPLPPLIRAWAEEAREWLVREGLSATVDAEKQQDDVAACAMEAGGVAQAPRSRSASKKDREVSGVDRDSGVVGGDLDNAVSDTLDEPCSQRRRVDHGTYGCEATATPRSSSALTAKMPASVRTPATSTRGGTTSSSFARAASAMTAGLQLGESNPLDEERFFREQRHVMRLYVALQDFVTACVRVRPEDRSSTAELLRHPFLTLCKDDI
ncbi:Protein kinase (STE family) [Leishmania donovani]|nr:Protein kinase (STE family) [Leishmania donovani]